MELIKHKILLTFLYKKNQQLLNKYTTWSINTVQHTKTD